MRRTSPVPKLSREVVLQAASLSDAEARFLVSDYYMFQKMRKAADMQIRHLGDKALPPSLQYVADMAAQLEGQIVRSLEAYSKANPVGAWCLAQYGIGPVITAGLLAHLQLKPTVGHWWRFAGLDPTCKWNKGQKRPWNAALKQICWHAGECFKRFSQREECFYGQLYAVHKQKVVERNERGDYAERAKVFVTNSAEVKKKLAEGRLPASNLDAQACRFAVKIFLSHLHAVWYWHETGEAPPKPFALAILGHAHEIRIPRLDLFPGLGEAYYGNRPE